MAGGTKKRKRTTWEPAEASKPWQHRRGRADTVNSPQTEEEREPSGFPFIMEEVEWTYERLELLDMAHKAIPGGYELMAGDINGVLGTLPSDKADLVRKSVLRA